MLEIERSLGPKKPDSYIVILKDHIDLNRWTRETLPEFETRWLEYPQSNTSIHGQFDHSRCHYVKYGRLNGFVGTFKENSSAWEALREKSEDIELVCEDSILFTQGFAHTQADAPWGISRISQDGKHSGINAMRSDFAYKYHSHTAVDVYLIDTGITFDHSEFGGRAKHGMSLYPDVHGDDNGHGTHCSATIAGQRFGISKTANLISVKVIGKDGYAPTSQILVGLAWVGTQLGIPTDFVPLVDVKPFDTKKERTPAIVNMSLGGSASTALDKEVNRLTAYGVHVIVAAGNHNNDARYYSPARVPSVITVGASTIRDTRAWFSNKGSLVDIYAPGVFVKSASNMKTEEAELKSGTSMACAHVTGLVAYLLGLNGNESPDDMKKRLKQLSVKDVLEDIPIGSVNELARNDANKDP